MSDPAPCAPRRWRIGRQQVLLSLLMAVFAGWLARAWVVPKWALRVEEGSVEAALALDSAISEVAGFGLAGLGLTLLASHFYAVFRAERLRRATRAQRDLDYLASLGHSRDSLVPTDDYRHP